MRRGVRSLVRLEPRSARRNCSDGMKVIACRTSRHASRTSLGGRTPLLLCPSSPYLTMLNAKGLAPHLSPSTPTAESAASWHLLPWRPWPCFKSHDTGPFTVEAASKSCPPALQAIDPSRSRWLRQREAYVAWVANWSTAAYSFKFGSDHASGPVMATKSGVWCSEAR